MTIELYTLSDISTILGIKSERLSHWLVRGFIKPSAKSKGQGKPSRFTRKDIYLIRLLKDILDHGIDGAEAAKCIEHIRVKLSLEGFLLEGDSTCDPPLDSWVAVSIARGHQPGISIKRDIMRIGDLRDWLPPENLEVIDAWEAQHDCVMLFNLYTLVRDVNKACDESSVTVQFSCSKHAPTERS